MNARLQWIDRRVRRTLWLLRRAETRGATIRYLAYHSAGMAFAHGRGLARSKMPAGRLVSRS